MGGSGGNNLPPTVNGGACEPEDSGGNNGIPANLKGVPYPQIMDLKTGESIVFPEDAPSASVPQEDRVSWGRNERGEFIKQWYDNGYSTPDGGWGNYEIHHILPREYGGTNDFDNLTPIRPGLHSEFTNWWRNWGC